jgi:REP element-mobilizing transposase RayT
VSATGGEAYFRDDRDRAFWLELFVATVDRHSWRCLTVCLLSTHWHAILELADDSLSVGMHRLVSGYTKRFNERHLRVGYLVRNRYWSRRKETPEQLLAAFRYVVRNPVRAGLVERPEDWAWSSYGTTVGTSDLFSFVDAADVLAEFGTGRAAQIAGLRRFVES